MQKEKTNLWPFLPFIEQLFAAAFFISLAPAFWGLYQASLGNVIQAVFFLVIWVILFTWVALALHKRNKVHLAISIIGAFFVLVIFWFGVLPLLP